MQPVECDLDDAALVQRVQEQDLAALGRLFDRYYAQVFRTALAITQEEAAADDIVQDCFLKLHRYADRIDTAWPLAPWLYRVTVNLSYTWIARQRRRRISLEAVKDYLTSPPGHAPDRAAEQAELQDHVRRAIGELSFNQRVVIVLHYLNGLSLEEIAEVVECPVGTVKSRLHYARENLRHKLDAANWTLELAHGYV